MKIENGVLISVDDNDFATSGNFSAEKRVLVVPEGVKTISSDALSKYKGLAEPFELELPKSLETIMDGAFDGTSITKASIPGGVRIIGKNAFRNSTIKKVSLGAGVESIDDSAFEGCRELTQINLPGSVKKLGSAVFRDCVSLRSAELPEQIYTLPEHIFSGCRQLSSVRLSKGLGTILGHAFSGCTSLKRLKFPYVRVVDEGAFENCSKLKNVDFSENLVEIGNSAFENCTFLRNFDFNDGLTMIGNFAFRGCENLRDCKLPQSVSAIGSEAFSQTGISAVEFSARTGMISSGLFKDCKRLKFAKIDDSVLIVGNSAFEGCDRLEFISNLPNLKTVGKRAFSGCAMLEDLLLPNSLESIGDEAFENCDSFTKVLIPAATKTLGQGVFKNCDQIEEAFINSKIIDLSDRFFMNCLKLKVVALPVTLRSIGKNAFFGCVGLPKIQIPDAVDSIGEGAFENCKSLTSVRIPGDVKEIRDSTFYNCESLESLALPEYLKVIGNCAFYGCKSLKDVVIPKRVHKIGDYAFSGCDSLSSLAVPASFQSFGQFDNKSMTYLSTEDGYFVISRDARPSSAVVSLEELKLSLSFFLTNFKYKDMLMREQRNPNIVGFYNKFLSRLDQSLVDNFLESHSFTFFKQLDIDSLGYGAVPVYTGLYNLGVFTKPVEVNGKMVDYAQKVTNMLLERQRKDTLDASLLCSAFSAMYRDGFKREFTDFFLENFDELMRVESDNNGFIAKCYNHFEEVQRTNTSDKGRQHQLKPTVTKFLDYFSERKFKDVSEQNLEIARTIGKFYSEQKAFDYAIAIDRERRQNVTPDNILSHSLSEKDAFKKIADYETAIEEIRAKTYCTLADIAESEFTFEWLAKNDPDNFILGKLCSGCGHIQGVGNGIVRASIVHPNIQNLVIRDNKGEIVAKATLFVNPEEGFGVFNTFQVYAGIPKTMHEQIYSKILLGAREFVKKYNLEHPDKPIKQLNVGMGFNDLRGVVKQMGERAKKLLPSIDYSTFGRPDISKHKGDSGFEQYVIWKNEEKTK